MEDLFGGLTLVELAVRGRWNAAVERAARFPVELTAQNEDGLNTLHLAAVNLPPFHLFAELLDTKYVKEACLMKDDSNMTPLLCATALFAPLEMIQALVQACPESVLVRDDFGATALHHVCGRPSRRGYSSMRRALARADILLQVEPRLATAQDDAAMMPIHTLCHEYEGEIHEYCLSHHQESSSNEHRSTWCFDLDGLWLFINALLLHCQPRSGNLLHQIVGLASPPPLALVMFACHPSLPIPTNEQDENGNTPLHLAAQRRLWDIACWLAERFPNCVTTRNGKGELPLERAANASTSFNKCLGRLITACPDTVRDVVKQDQLYPLLFRNLLTQSSRELEGPSAIFDILKLRPSLVARSPTTTIDEEAQTTLCIRRSCPLLSAMTLGFWQVGLISG